MKSPLVFFWSLDQLLRILWALVAVGGLGLCVLYLWSPEIAPVPPGELSRPDLSRLTDDAADAGQSDEFVSRPLFLQGRRPLLVVKASPVTVVKDDPAPPPKVLERVKLLGIFSSGDSKGVILEENGGDRRRLLVGDKTGAWTLTAVEPRGAVFESGGVARHLAMGLLAAGLPKARRAPSAPVTREEGAKVASGEGAEQPKKRQRKKAADDAGASGGAPDTEKRD
jgi:hypothetical protein